MSNGYYRVFGDNIKDTYDFLISLSNRASSINVVDKVTIDDSIIDQIVFKLNITNSNEEIYLKICGNYENWNLSEDFNDLFLIDRPDIVIQEAHTDRIACVAEFTDTVSVGNSQFQRQARILQAAKIGAPFMLEMPEIQKDRSTDSLRVPEAESIANHFILSYLFKTPSVIILSPHYYSYIDSKEASREISRRADYLDSLKYDWFIYTILNDFNQKNYFEQLKRVQIQIYQTMMKTLDSNNFNSTLTLFRADILKNNNNLNTLVDICHKHDKNLASIIDLSKNSINVDWIDKGKSGKVFNRCDFKNNFLAFIKEQYPQLKIYSYQPSAVAGICFETSLLIEAISKFYNVSLDDLKKHFDVNSPSTVITVLGYQKSGSLADPSTGEIAYFSSLLSKGTFKNVVVSVFGPLPKNWEATFDKKSNKLMRAINEYAALAILGKHIKFTENKNGKS